jgi:hypothetical protein
LNPDPLYVDILGRRILDVYLVWDMTISSLDRCTSMPKK